jgi:hypothetical protein
MKYAPKEHGLHEELIGLHRSHTTPLPDEKLPAPPPTFRVDGSEATNTTTGKKKVIWVLFVLFALLLIPVWAVNQALPGAGLVGSIILFALYATLQHVL